MKKAIIPRWAVFSIGIQKQKPAASKVQHMFGKVKSKSLLKLVLSSQ